MSNEHVEQSVSAFIDQELSGTESAEMFAHLGSCESCRLFFQQTLQVRSAMQMTGLVEAPESLNKLFPTSRRQSQSRFTGMLTLWDVNFSIPLPAAASIAFLIVAGTMLLAPLVVVHDEERIQSSEQSVGALPEQLRSQLQKFR